MITANNKIECRFEKYVSTLRGAKFHIHCVKIFLEILIPSSPGAECIVGVPVIHKQENTFFLLIKISKLWGPLDCSPLSLFYKSVSFHLKYYNILSSFLFHVLYVITGYT